MMVQDRTRVGSGGGGRRVNQTGLLLDWGVGLKRGVKGTLRLFGTGSWC